MREMRGHASRISSSALRMSDGLPDESLTLGGGKSGQIGRPIRPDSCKFDFRMFCSCDESLLRRAPPRHRQRWMIAGLGLWQQARFSAHAKCCGTAFGKEASLPPLPLKFARAAPETSMPAEPSTNLKNKGFSKKANGHIGDGSTEFHAAQAFGGSEPTSNLLILYCLQSQHQYSCICSSYCAPMQRKKQPFVLPVVRILLQVLSE